MKISKLFHWLYAILMLLPVVVFIPNAFYYGFNETAVAQEKTEQVPVYYESNTITSYEDFYVDRVYFWQDNVTIPTLSQNYTLFTIKPTDNLSFVNNLQPTDVLQIYLTTNGNTIRIRQNNYYTYDIVNLGFYFIIDYLDSGIQGANLVINGFKDYSNMVIKDYQPLVTNMSITDSMSYAWDSVWQNDLFSWTYDSFLTDPFLYITNLFNVPANNTLVYCLSYWLNLSIIWLTFDVIMYVPLLVHRWLDKGIIE